MKTVSDLLKAIEGREDYEIVNECYINFSSEFYYEGSLNFIIDFNNKIHSYGKDVINMIKKKNIPLDVEVCLRDDFFPWTSKCDFKIDNDNKLIIIKEEF